MRRFRLRAAIIVSVVAVACGDGPSTSQPPGSGSQTTPAEQTLLERIQADGVIRVATDARYQPLSWYVPASEEWRGFDVEVALEIAARLGVTAEIQPRDWETEITAGAWNDRWDMNVGSMTVTTERAELFSFTSAYYYTSAAVAVHADNTSITDLTTDLDGKKVCVGKNTTYESYLLKTLEIPGSTFDLAVDDAEILPFEVDNDAMDRLKVGDGVRCDAVITATTVIDGFVADGAPVKEVGDPLYGEPLAVAFDRYAQLDPTSLVDAVSGIIEEMHNDGTLSELSFKWFEEDITEV